MFSIICLSFTVSGQPFTTASLQVSGPADQTLNDIHVAANGSMYLAGKLTDSAQFDPDSSAAGLLSAGDGFVVRYRPSGDLEVAWTVPYQVRRVRTFADKVYVLAFDDAGLHLIQYDNAGTLLWQSDLLGDLNGKEEASALWVRGDTIFVAGSARSIDLDPGAGTVSLSTAGESLAFIAKFDNSGNLAQHTSFEPLLSGPDKRKVVLRDLVITADASLYFCGNIRATVDFDPGPDSIYVFASPSSDEAFLARINPVTFNVLWVETGSSDRYTAVDADDAGVYVTGKDELNIVTARYSPTGTLTWLIGAPGTSSISYGLDVLIGGDERVYFTGKLDRGSLLGSARLSDGGASDFIEFAFDSLDLGIHSEGTAMIRRPNGIINIGGRYLRGIDLDPTSDVIWLDHVAADDLYLWAFHPTCDILTPPQNVNSTVDLMPGGSVTLSWDPVIGTVGCRATGRKLGSPTGGVVERGGFEIGSITVPLFGLELNADYQWYVSCICSLTPFVSTPVSAVDTFSTDTTVLRMAPELQFQVEDAIYNLQGQKIPADSWQEQPAGMYIRIEDGIRSWIRKD